MRDDDQIFVILFGLLVFFHTASAALGAFFGARMKRIIETRGLAPADKQPNFALPYISVYRKFREHGLDKEFQALTIVYSAARFIMYIFVPVSMVLLFVSIALLRFGFGL